MIPTGQNLNHAVLRMTAQRFGQIGRIRIRFKFGVPFQKRAHLPFIFLRQQRAGGIHQPPAHAHIARAGIQNRLLNRNQRIDGFIGQTVFDIRLIAHHAEAGAGCVHQHRIHLRFQIFIVFLRVARLRADVVQPQPLCRRPNQLHAVFVQIPRIHAPAAAHRLGDAAGLAARRSARIQNLHAPPRAHRRRRQHRTFALNGKQSAPVALVRRQPARVFHDVRAVHDGFFKFEFVFGQPRFKFRVRHAHMVGAHRLAAAIRRPCRDRFRFLRAVGGNQARHQRGRDGIFLRNIRFHIRIFDLEFAALHDLFNQVILPIILSIFLCALLQFFPD